MDLLQPLGLMRECVEGQWKGDATYVILKFDSYDDFGNTYLFFKKKFDPRCFNIGGGVLPEIILNRRGVEELAKLWNLNIEPQSDKTIEIEIQSRLEAAIEYLLLLTKK